MIQWEKLLEDPEIGNDQVALRRLGAELKELYSNLVTSGTAEAELQIFEACAIEAVEEVTKYSADELRESYYGLRLPRRDDSPRVAVSFIGRVVGRFRDVLCTELYENRDLSANTRDLLVVLAPTIITLLNLPLPYAALAIPISVILSKIGLESLCQGNEILKQSKEFVEQRLEIHRRNLLFLEEESSRLPPGPARDIVEAAIVREESKILQLEEELRSF
jgi:hypothetical protein